MTTGPYLGHMSKTVWWCMRFMVLGLRTGEVRSWSRSWVYAWDCPLLMTVDDVEDDYILVRIWSIYFISVLILLSVYLKILQLRLSGSMIGVLDSLM